MMMQFGLTYFQMMVGMDDGDAAERAARCANTISDANDLGTVNTPICSKTETLALDMLDWQCQSFRK